MRGRSAPRPRSSARSPPREGPRREGRHDAWSFPFPGLSIARGPPDDRPTYWTRALGEPPDVYGERLRRAPDATWRAIDPFRSKLGAALCKGVERLPLRAGGRVLYLGAASGTTVSHVADVVGRRGEVYAVEKSPRPFQKLLEVARRWPNLLPLLEDVREPRRYLPLVPPVDALYLDVATPEQVDVAMEHGRLFLREGGGLLLALKVPSLRPGGTSEEQVGAALRVLGRGFDLAPPKSLEPFHRGHYFLSGTFRRA